MPPPFAAPVAAAGGAPLPALPAPTTPAASFAAKDILNNQCLLFLMCGSNNMMILLWGWLLAAESLIFLAQVGLFVCSRGLENTSTNC
jgi:hypothetical protein